MAIDYVQALNALVRDVIRTACGMVAGSVRPAEQKIPAGKQGLEIATVKILSVDEIGTPAVSYANVAATDEEPAPTDVTETLMAPQRFTASVNFLRGADVDASGQAVHTNAAVSRAARLGQLLSLSTNVEIMNSYGLGFVRASSPRDLTALVDGGWESRGQVDLDFTVINAESVRLASIGSVSLTVKAQTPGNTVHQETGTITE